MASDIGCRKVQDGLLLLMVRKAPSPSAAEMTPQSEAKDNRGPEILYATLLETSKGRVDIKSAIQKATKIEGNNRNIPLSIR